MSNDTSCFIGRSVSADSHLDFNALHRHFPSDPRWNRFSFHLFFVERHEVYHNDSVVSIAMTQFCQRDPIGFSCVI